MSANHHGEVLKHHFDNLEQQHAAERLGMWFFLVTEVLFFSGLFVAYTVYRNWYPAEFAFASSHLILWIAGVNTGLLITSSLTMTLAIRSAQLGDRRALIRHLLATFVLGAGFLGFKALEYYTDINERFVPGVMFRTELAKAEEELAASHGAAGHHGTAQHWAADLAKNNAGKSYTDPGYISPGRVQLFLCFYYIMTGIHGIHILVGLGCILWLVQQAAAGKIPRENYSTVEVVSLYWHLVDMIWLFLMPLLYLAGAGTHAAGH
ncbi:MAG: cytochrome c oxidase subunit 3 [Gemmataceae bacterium]|nr:cytochrome c oxidase subunit 3 [Gemmataceae bacterium]